MAISGVLEGNLNSSENDCNLVFFHSDISFLSIQESRVDGVGQS